MQEISINAKCDDPMPVLEFQSRHGFAGVPEASMKKLFKQFVTNPIFADPSDLDVPDDVQEAAQLARAILPNMTDSELQQALLERMASSDEITDSVFEDVVNDDSIGDCLREQDRRAMKEHLQSKQRAKAKRVEHQKSIQNYMKWEATTRGKPNQKGKEKAAKKSHKDKPHKWWQTVRGDLEFINKNRPSVGSVVQDDSNGRFLVSYPGRYRKSFSWSTRGMEEASICVLKTMWDWHTNATGEECPLPL